MTKTSIEWATDVWNPSTGCDRVSPGCDLCYALTMAKRLKGMGSDKYQRDGDPKTSGPGFGLTVHPDALELPLRWRRPRLVFVNSMSDLFHDQVPDEFIARVWAVMAATPQHTYQVLTKRHGRMRSLLNRGTVGTAGFFDDVEQAMAEFTHAEPSGWPLPNVWLGCSVEDQKRADLRIPALLETPAAVRFLSCEPLIGPVDLAGRGWLPVSAADPDPDAECVTCGTEEFSDRKGHPVVHRCGSRNSDPCEVNSRGDCVHDGDETGTWCDGPIRSYPHISWLIAGGESGSGARPMHPDWARSLRDQCTAAGVPFFFKQWGEWVHRKDSVELVRVGKKQAGRELDGRIWNEYPTGLVRS